MPILTKRTYGFTVAIMLAVGGVVLLSRCSNQSELSATTYVLVSPLAADGLLRDTANAMKTQGLLPIYLRTDTGSVRSVHSIEAKGDGVVVQISKLPLSGDDCTAYPGLEVDPGQFYVAVKATMWKPFAKARAARLSHALSSYLTNRGYNVLNEAVRPCSAMPMNRIS